MCIAYKQKRNKNKETQINEHNTIATKYSSNYMEHNSFDMVLFDKII